VHQAGGPLDGPNLADVSALARAEVQRRGGVDALAERAADGTLDSSSVRVDAAVPDGLATWARPALTRLHRRVRNVSVSVRRDRVATFEANVPGLLADRLRAQRDRLIDAPDRYPDVAHRARVGVRAAYVDRVLARLDRAAAAHDRGRERLERHLPETEQPPSRLLSAARTAARWDADRPATAVRTAIAATPSYLTLEAVDGAALAGTGTNRSEYPMVARNLNAFAVPTTDVVDGLFGALAGPEPTRVRTGAQVLRVANRSGIHASNASTVRDDLEGTAHAFRVAAVRGLTRHDLGDRRSRAAVVAAALDRWAGPGPRAGAVANGSASEAVHQAAVNRWPTALSSESERERLSIALDGVARAVATSRSAGPEQAAVNGTVREIAAALGVADRARAAVDERAAALAARLPSGMPVLLAPGLWYATVNVWHVQVRGSYARFVVRVPRGAPDRLPADFRYVRENRTVSLDVDGDGDAERLGHNRRIDVRAATAVGVAVPPQPAGVGDAGERDERSPGWPRPGPTDE
jgi:hypothetical protein